MASNINPNSIDVTFPIAGVDNASQGFRDNYTNIKTNFEYSEAEIVDLQTNALLKNALIGEVLDNDMDGAVIKNAEMLNMSHTVMDYGTIEGVVEIDVEQATYGKITVGATNDVDLNFTNWPVVGKYSKVIVELLVNDAALDVLTIPASVVNTDGIQNYNNNEIRFNAPGTYIYEFFTIDGGNTIFMSDLTQSRNNFYRTIDSSVGVEGDKQGMFAFGPNTLATDNYIYMCLADYDGTTDIWTRTVLNALTW